MAAASRGEEENPGRLKSEEGDGESVDLNAYLPDPPDGGWGWIIVLSSFMNHFILDGIAYAFGVYLDDYQAYFSSSKGVTSMLMSVLLGTYMLTAPVASALVNRYGSRAVGIIGSLFAGVSFLLSTLSPNIYVMIVLFGVGGGIGFGFMYLPAVVSVGMYFGRKRPIATGIGMCGTGVGMLVFGPLGERLLTVYDWKNCHYILAGIIFNGCVFSSLIRPLEYGPASSPPSTQAEDKRSLVDPHSHDNLAESKYARPIDHTVMDHTAESNKQRLYEDQLGGRHKVNGGSNFISHNHISKNHLNVDSTAMLRSLNILKSTDTVRFRNAGAAGGVACSRTSIEDLHRPLYRKDIFYSGSVLNIRDVNPASSHYGHTTGGRGHGAEAITSMLSVAAIEEPHYENRCLKWLPPSVVSVLAEMLNFSLLADRSMALMFLTSTLVMMGYFIPFAYVNNLAKQRNIPSEDAAFLISVLGISNMFGRIGTSAAAQIPHVSPLAVHNICTTAAGVIILCFPFATTYESLIACCVTYGILVGGHVSLNPLILCELFGVENLTTAYGLVTLARGFATIAGTPTAGAIYDATNSYDMAFFMAGAFVIAGGLLCYLNYLPFFMNHKSKALTNSLPSGNGKV